MKKTLFILFVVISSLVEKSYAQIITTFAGNGTQGFSGDGGQATNAEFYTPEAAIFDAAGNCYIGDANNERIRKITTAGIISTFAGTGTMGYSGDGGQATNAEIWNPMGLAFDAVGNLYFCDEGNHHIRVINTSGIISTIAGNGTGGYSGDGGQATNAALFHPGDITFGATGNLYIADNFNYRIRMVTTASIISTIAGTGTAGYSGDGGQATAAKLNYPVAVAFDTAGNLYITDFSNSRIRMVNTAGIISTIAGNGTAGYSGDGGQATAAELNYPVGIVFDSVGNLYIADQANRRVRKVNTAGIITTIAGNGTAGFSGDNGCATNAELQSPHSLVFDAAGNLYIVDGGNNNIRKVSTQTCTTMGIEQVAKTNEQVNVYPNPAQNSLQVTVAGNSKIQAINLYDVLGNEVISTNAKEIDVSSLSNGVYFIKIKTNEDFYSKKIIVQH